MKNSLGETFGPVPRVELEQWVAEGRVTADSQVLRQGADQWQWASSVFPVLASSDQPQPLAGGPVATSPGAAAPPGAAMPGTHPGRRRPMQPHRGGLVLALGIIGWFVPCPVLGMIAWYLGSVDLKLMRAGRMNRSGRGMTMTGQIMGMVTTVGWFFCISINSLMLLLQFLAEG
jgi:hypothetical protein